MTPSHSPHILLVRTDRIGDVVLTLPLIPVIRSKFPNARISMLLRSYTQELASNYPGLDSLFLYDDRGVIKPFRAMLTELRRECIEVVIVAYPTFRLAMLMFLAGIPVRVGTGFRWYSFLFNRRVYEHRKTAEKHEVEYNFSLLRRLEIPFNRYEYPRLYTTSRHESAAQVARRELGLLEADRVVVLHPGSGGSARDWSAEKFGQLGKELLRRGYAVVVTGGPGEERLAERVRNLAGERARSMVNRLTLAELAAFFRTVDLVVANSTGPLHIAAAVGTPVVGFYPPILACSPRRWGPYAEQKAVFVPDPHACPRCRGKACQGNDCMDQISVDEVVMAIERTVRPIARRTAEVHS